jgi:WD40 repeat protein
LAPTGDRLLTGDEPPSLWDLDTGKAVSWSAYPGRAPAQATFNPAGDLVLLGGGVFRTSDGALVRAADPEGRTARFAFQAFALSPDGTSAVLSEFGRATLETVSAPGTATVLGGPPPLPDGRTARINHIASSADGSVVVANVLGIWAFGVRPAPNFADSRIVSTLFAEVNADVDVSADGALATIAGDGRALFGAQDGRILWRPPVPLPTVPSCPTEKLRLSPKKTWAAGANYFQVLDVFPITDTAGVEGPLPLLSVPSGCGDSAVFSRDERLMATSLPALYRTGTTAAGWQKVWSGPEPAKASSLDLNASGFGNDVRFSPDESQLLVSQCATWDTCSSRLLDVASGAVVRDLPQLTGPHPAFSPDGSWIVAGGTLVHLSTGETRTLSSVGAPDTAGAPAVGIITALFTPDGNIIAGSSDGSLTRYCRTP